MTTVSFGNGNRNALARPRSAEITATALELYAVRFLPCKAEFDFTPGTLLAKLHTNGRLEEAHLRAAQRAIADLEQAVGKSDERITPASDSYDRLRLLIDEQLTKKERLLFIDFFVKDYFQRGRNGEALPEIGRLLSGYQGKPQATAAAAARIQALLERIAAYYAEI